MNVINKPTELIWDKLPNHSNFIAEPKLDGIRVQVERGKIIRDEHTKNLQFPEVVEVSQSLPENTLLDGEICILQNDYRADFWHLSTRINVTNQTKINLLRKKIPATFVPFDILKLNGEDVTNQDLETRLGMLGRLETFKPMVKMPFDVNDEKMLNFITEYDLEGIVVKKLSGNYNSNWFKFKNYKEDDFRVIGTTSGIRTISALILQDIHNGNEVGSVNANPRIVEQTEEFAKKVIGMTAKVRYMLTNKNKLRFPVLKELVA